jgi:hypothetical protein
MAPPSCSWVVHQLPGCGKTRPGTAKPGEPSAGLDVAVELVFPSRGEQRGRVLAVDLAHRIPLGEVDLWTAEDYGQLSLRDGFGAECQGLFGT